MMPTASSLPITGPGTVPYVEVSPPQPANDVASAAAPTELGTEAVTQSQASSLPTLNADTSAKLDAPEIPPDPPPLKGLGVPALNTLLVGDFDQIETEPLLETTVSEVPPLVDVDEPLTETMGGMDLANVAPVDNVESPQTETVEATTQISEPNTVDTEGADANPDETTNPSVASPDVSDLLQVLQDRSPPGMDRRA